MGGASGNRSIHQGTASCRVPASQGHGCASKLRTGDKAATVTAGCARSRAPKTGPPPQRPAAPTVPTVELLLWQDDLHAVAVVGGRDGVAEDAHGPHHARRFAHLRHREGGRAAGTVGWLWVCRARRLAGWHLPNVACDMAGNGPSPTRPAPFQVRGSKTSPGRMGRQMRGAVEGEVVGLGVEALGGNAGVMHAGRPQRPRRVRGCGPTFSGK